MILIDQEESVIYLLVHNSEPLTELYVGVGIDAMSPPNKELRLLRNGQAHSNPALSETFQRRLNFHVKERLNQNTRYSGVTKENWENPTTEDYFQTISEYHAIPLIGVLKPYHTKKSTQHIEY